MRNTLLFFLILILFFAPSTSVISQQLHPNILLIIADDMGNDAIDGFGLDHNSYPVVPTIDSLKASGISYLNNWANPLCTPTRAGIMSGKYGVKTGVKMVPGNLGLEHESLFNYLNRNLGQDYSSAVIGKWHISNPANPDHPSEHGIDHFQGVLTGAVNDYYNWDKIEDGITTPIDEYFTSHVTDASIDWIGDQTQPWFLWLAHVAPHQPFQVPPAGLFTTPDPTTEREIYNASIEALDHEIGRLLNSLDQETRENTLVIFIGDNGTPRVVLEGYPRGHGKGTLFEGGVRTPMVISGVGVERKGVNELGLTQVHDIYSTVIEAFGIDLPGGIYNSYSLQPTFAADNAIERDYVYTDLKDDEEVERWAIRNDIYKLIDNDIGEQEFYRIDNDIDELDNLIGNLSDNEMEILRELELEADAIREAWSCQDFILNGDEQSIDDCNDTMICSEVDNLGFENIGCCASPEEPSVFYEYEENNNRVIYTNGFPNHDYCFNPNNVPLQSHHLYNLNREPIISGAITPIIRENGRPARHFGVALNGVLISPAPGAPFIYTNKLTGEFNWDWVFEPTTNQGDGVGEIRLDCATAHNNAAGYHYHGEMFEYLENVESGITSATTLPEPIQIGWASDGFPIIYKFGPDQDGVMRELLPSYVLREGERPGDGIEAPCGPYTGKYTVDYEFDQTLGDLDECNGMATSITLETALGAEQFDYFYVVTSLFPQVPRCLVGSVSPDFENNADVLTGVDIDGDGFLEEFDCNDNDFDINPLATEVPNNGIDENCDGEDLLTATHELSNASVTIYPNPTSKRIHIELNGNLKYKAILLSLYTSPSPRDRG